jgi:cytochrome c556
MISRRMVLAASTMIVLACWAASGPADDAKPKNAEPPKKQSVMERKLKHAQTILELTKCVKEATWRINDTDKYLSFSTVFLGTLEDLQKAAKKQNLDAATLAYVDMTRSCVKCHTHLRETRVGQFPEFRGAVGQ